LQKLSWPRKYCSAPQDGGVCATIDYKSIAKAALFTENHFKQIFGKEKFMSKFRIVPLSKEFAEKIRQSRKDEFGNDVVEQIATGYGPCRVSLTPFTLGEDKRLLFSHSPFTERNAFNQNGPVFIHEKEVEPYSDIYRFPPAIKADKVNFPLSLIGYSSKQKMVFTKLVGDVDVDELIVKIFDEHPKVEFLHARNAEACCYICKIERA
jgi:hypothetical protein